MQKLLENIEKYILYSTVFLFSLAVLPISPNPFVVTKLAILTFGVVLSLLALSAKTIYKGELKLNLSTFDFPILLIAVAYIASTILRTPNKMEALVLPGTTVIIVASILLYFLINQLAHSAKEGISKVLIASSAVFSLFIILASLGVFNAIPQLPAFIKQVNYSPEGGYLPSAIYLLTVLPIAVAGFLSNKDITAKVMAGVGSALILVGIAISVYKILPGKPLSPRFPDFNTSWFVAIDTLKESPLLGVGPANYLTAFNRFKPLSFNQTDLWGIRFSTANNFYLTTFTETGLLGAAGFILLIMSIYKLLKKGFKERKLVGWGFAGAAPLISLALLIVLMALFPATLILVVLLFVLLALNSQVTKTNLNLTTQAAHQEGKLDAQTVSSRLPAILVTLPIIALVILVIINSSKYLRAEYTFRKSLNQLSQNQAIQAYDTMRQAIQINPLVDRYHASYSQVNMALANAIAQSAITPDAEGKTREVTDQDRANIAQLIQQSIREAKSTVALNPLRSGNWEILARTYRAIIPFAQGADQFAIQTYAQAVALEPTNPNLRISLGGVYYAIGNFDAAARVFELAVATKQDLANSHYNLAFAYQEIGQLDAAVQQMSIVLSLVDRNSTEYEAVAKTLEDMQAKRDEITKSGTENLNAPQEAEQILEPPLDLPEGSEPPEAPITPTPTPTEEEEAAVTPQITPTPRP